MLNNVFALFLEYLERDENGGRNVCDRGSIVNPASNQLMELCADKLPFLSSIIN